MSPCACHWRIPLELAKVSSLLASLGLAGTDALGAVEFTPLGIITGTSYSQAVAVSGDGTVATGVTGFSQCCDPEAFLWTRAGGMVRLSAIGGPQGVSRASSTSGDGSVVVGNTGSQPGREAFRWSDSGGSVGLGYFLNAAPTNRESLALGVSADGTVVVGQGNYGGTVPHYYAFRWTSAGGMLDLGVLPGGTASYAAGVSDDGAVVVGWSFFPNVWQAFRWTEGGGMVGLGYLPGGSNFSQAAAASADGAVVVGTSSSTPGNQAFRWTSGGGMVGLGDLAGGAYGSQAAAVSDNGNVVTGSGTSAAGIEAFVWTAADGMQNLQALLVSSGATGLTGWMLNTALGVSADGSTVVGYGTNPSGQTEAFIATLPRDTDGDGLKDPQDNCIAVANADQRDSDGDGYGNICDADLNNSGLVTAADFTLLRSVFNRAASFSSLAAAADMNGSGTVTAADFTLLRAGIGKAPGPSGLHP